MTFPLAIMEYQMGFLKTIILTNIGGILGIIMFLYLSDKLIILWNKSIAAFFRRIFKIKKKIKAKKIVFNKKNRRIVRIKSNYGLSGIAISTPILLSIPVGAFLLIRYFNHKKYKFLYLLGGNIIWSFIYTIFYSFFWDLIHTA